MTCFGLRFCLPFFFYITSEVLLIVSFFLLFPFGNLLLWVFSWCNIYLLLLNFFRRSTFCLFPPPPRRCKYPLKFDHIIHLIYLVCNVVKHLDCRLESQDFLRPWQRSRFHSRTTSRHITDSYYSTRPGGIPRLAYCYT